MEHKLLRIVLRAGQAAIGFKSELHIVLIVNGSS
jgi:hypothetical protein